MTDLCRNVYVILTGSYCTTVRTLWKSKDCSLATVAVEHLWEASSLPVRPRPSLRLTFGSLSRTHISGAPTEWAHHGVESGNVRVWRGRSASTCSRVMAICLLDRASTQEVAHTEQRWPATRKGTRQSLQLTKCQQLSTSRTGDGRQVSSLQQTSSRASLLKVRDLVLLDAIETVLHLQHLDVCTDIAVPC